MAFACMTSDQVSWTYALAPDVEVEPGLGGASLRTAVDQIWIEGDGELKALERLKGAGGSEAEISELLALDASDSVAGTRGAALLFRLDRLGLLARSLNSRGRRLASCVPARPPPEAPPERPPAGPLRLSPAALARIDGDAVSLEQPGAWAKLTIHDRALLSLIHDLATKRTAHELAAAGGHSQGEILELLALMDWCRLLDRADREDWSSHDLFFHARTRDGYARVPLGKTGPAKNPVPPPAPSATAEGRRLVLPRPDLERLLAEDPPHALVSERRKSVRRHGSVPLSANQVSEFLFRTLHEREGRRPYPSGGACYPLTAYLAVHRCLGIPPGLYAYDPALHELVRLGEPRPGLDRLLLDAARAADVEEAPQVLLVLAARYARTRRAYRDLSYSLIMKEVGAVFQAAMMSAAAMGLAACPLGCGNSLLFSSLTGFDPLTETSVGELMLGSFEEAAGNEPGVGASRGLMF
jgi:SagB-type dehydrogenase family enzyme